MERHQDKTKILVADDDDELRSLLVLWLNKLGYSVSEAATVEEAVRQAQLMQPDIILMDIALPERSGISAVYQIRKQLASKPPTVIAITAYNYSDLHRDAQEAGCLAVLTKPFELQDLESLLKKLPDSGDA